MTDWIEPQMGNATSPHRIPRKVKHDVVKLSVCDDLGPNARFLAHFTLWRRPKQLRLVLCADYAHPRDDTGTVSRLDGREIADQRRIVRIRRKGYALGAGFQRAASHAHEADPLLQGVLVRKVPGRPPGLGLRWGQVVGA